MSVESRQEFIATVVRTAAKLGCYVLCTEDMNDGSSWEGVCRLIPSLLRNVPARQRARHRMIAEHDPN